MFMATTTLHDSHPFNDSTFCSIDDNDLLKPAKTGAIVRARRSYYIWFHVYCCCAFAPRGSESQIGFWYTWAFPRPTVMWVMRCVESEQAWVQWLFEMGSFFQKLLPILVRYRMSMRGLLGKQCTETEAFCNPQ